MRNGTMDQLAVGAVFQHGHDRDGKGNKWVKVSNRLARRLGDPMSIPATLNAPASADDEYVARLDVTCFGNEASYQEEP